MGLVGSLGCISCLKSCICSDNLKTTQEKLRQNHLSMQEKTLTGFIECVASAFGLFKAFCVRGFIFLSPTSPFRGLVSNLPWASRQETHPSGYKTVFVTPIINLKSVATLTLYVASSDAMRRQDPMPIRGSNNKDKVRQLTRESLLL